MSFRFYRTHDWKGDPWRGDYEEIVPIAREAGHHSIGYEDYDDGFQDHLLAEGGVCIDPDCHCEGQWEYWRNA